MKNRIFEEVVEVLSKKYELVSREEKKNVYGQPIGEECIVKCSVPVKGYDFLLGIVVDRSYRSDMVQYVVGEYRSMYPLTDFDDHDYVHLIRDVAALMEEECVFLAPMVKEAMEDASEQLEDYLDELIESCKHM